MTTKKENTKELTQEVMTDKMPDYMGKAQEIIWALDEGSVHQMEKHKELEKLLLDIFESVKGVAGAERCITNILKYIFYE